MQSKSDTTSHALNLRSRSEYLKAPGFRGFLAVVCGLHFRSSSAARLRPERAGVWGSGKPATAVAVVMAMKLRASLFGILMLTTTLPIGAGERITVQRYARPWHSPRRT